MCGECHLAVRAPGDCERMGGYVDKEEISNGTCW